jgi:hypothetical protein
VISYPKNINHSSFNTQLFIYAALLMFIYQSAGKIINSNSEYYLLFLVITFLSFLNYKKPLALFLRVSYDLIPIYLYFFYFLLSSIWALYPYEAVYFVINDSIYLFASILFGLIYYQFTLRGILYFFQCIAYLSLLLSVGMFIYLPEITNIGGNSTSVLFAIFPYLIISDQKNIFYKYFPIICSLIVILLSISRTPLLSVLITTTIVLFITRKGIFDLFKTLLNYLIYVLVIMGCLSFIPYVRQVFILFIFKFSGLDLGYTSRILVLQEDDLRTSIFNEALNVYYEYWFQGMGYMNFMKWYGEKFGISELTANGTEIVGMNLHNSFQTWALEGGIFAIIIIIYIMYVYIKRSIYKIKISQNQFEKNFHTVGLINIVSFIIFASYHQLHQNIIFFILLGIVLKRKSVIKSNSLEA